MKDFPEKVVIVNQYNLHVYWGDISVLTTRLNTDYVGSIFLGSTTKNHWVYSPEVLENKEFLSYDRELRQALNKFYLEWLGATSAIIDL